MPRKSKVEGNKDKINRLSKEIKVAENKITQLTSQISIEKERITSLKNEIQTVEKDMIYDEIKAMNLTIEEVMKKLGQEK